MIKIERRNYVDVVVLLSMVLMLSACGSPLVITTQDTDRDSVADAIDACPETVLTSPVDEQGCSLFRGAIEGVVFDPGKNQLSVASRIALKKLVDRLNAYPKVALRLEGHTDNRGSAAKNLDLSKHRVMAVTRFLVANGIASKRLQPIGLGENRPIASNATEEGRIKNRRIEISVVDQ